MLRLTLPTSSPTGKRLSIPSRMLLHQFNGRAREALQLSIPSRMLHANRLMHIIVMDDDFQFLLGCFLCQFSHPPPNRFSSFQFLLGCFLEGVKMERVQVFNLSIPSRMLLIYGKALSNLTVTSFQFLLGCFFKEAIKRFQAEVLHFQFLLGCFDFFVATLDDGNIFQFLLGCFTEDDLVSLSHQLARFQFLLGCFHLAKTTLFSW